MGGSRIMKKLNTIDKKLIKWLVNTYIDKSWLHYDDLHFDIINKKEPINNINYWLLVLQKISYYRDLLHFDVSICLNIGIDVEDIDTINKINTINDASKYIDLESMPSYYVIGKNILNSFIEDKVKVIYDNPTETAFISSYIHPSAENNEVTTMLSIISFTHRDYKKFTEIGLKTLR